MPAAASGTSGPGALACVTDKTHARVSRRAELGLCWLISTRRKHPPVVWHNGGTWGFRSFAAFSPEPETATIVLWNSVRSVDRVGFRLTDLRP